MGTNLLGMVQAAERIGFTARPVKGPYESLVDVPLPAIAHIVTEERTGHYVVLHKVTNKGVVVADPARGICKMSEAEFTERWSGYLIILDPDRARLDKTKDESPTPRQRLTRMMMQHKRFLLEAFVCALLMTALGIGSSLFIQHLVDSVFVSNQRRLLDALGIGMIAIVLFRALFGALRQYLMAYVGRQAALSLISDYARHVMRLPMRFFEMRQVGEILSRVNDAAKIRDAISGVTLTALVDGALVVFSLVVLWIYDAHLAAVATLFVPVMVFTVIAHHPASRRRSRQAMERSAVLQSHLVEDVSGIETIKALGTERQRSDESDDRLTSLVQSAFSLQKLGVSMSSLATFAMGAAGVVILWYGGYRVADGALTIGQLMFFHSLLGNMLGPLERLSSINLQLQDALVAVDRLYQVMDIEQEGANESRKAAMVGPQRAIKLDNVSFQYGSRAPVLKNLDMVIPAGATVAIVGESGSGKSTLLKLLMRYYEPSEGRIEVDGVDVRDFTLESVRNGLGIVSQEPTIFAGTVLENVAMGNPSATMEQVVAAVRAAGLEEVVAKMPSRFETMLGERGANLSGGQRQRIAIARALLRNPDILIFDEATSHLDTATERAIQKSMRTELAGRTVVLVAHRLSTIRHADIIYVLHDGEIAERGMHADLLALGGRYAELCAAQAGDDTVAPIPTPTPTPTPVATPATPAYVRRVVSPPLAMAAGAGHASNADAATIVMPLPAPPEDYDERSPTIVGMPNPFGA